MKMIAHLMITLLVAVFALNVGVGQVHASGPTSSFSFLNPCNGDSVLISADIHVTGNGALVISNATGVDQTTGNTYTVSYQYSVGGNRSFIVNLQLVGANGGYAEHDLFLFDANGNVTRIVENTSCK